MSAEPARRDRTRLYYSLVVIIVVQMMLTAATFLGATYWATKSAEQQQHNALCPLVVILQAAYHDPSLPNSDAPRIVALRAAMDGLSQALHCSQVVG